MKGVFIILPAAMLIAGCSRSPEQVQTAPQVQPAQTAIAPDAHPLSVASKNAAEACWIVGIDSLEVCGNQTIRSAANTEARSAVGAALAAHSAFMEACRLRIEDCQARAEYLIERGYAMATLPVAGPFSLEP